MGRWGRGGGKKVRGRGRGKGLGFGETSLGGIFRTVSEMGGGGGGGGGGGVERDVTGRAFLDCARAKRGPSLEHLAYKCLIIVRPHLYYFFFSITLSHVFNKVPHEEQSTSRRHV